MGDPVGGVLAMAATIAAFITLTLIIVTLA